VTDAVVTANDGKGTNVLSTVNGASLTVGTGAPSQTTTTSATSAAAPTVAAPAPVVRQAAVATGLPGAPKIRVPLYPDQSRWYNQKGDVVAFWDLPDDVVQVSTRLSQGKDKVPGTIDEQLFNGKDFGKLQNDGVWYIRIQFKNNVGWGPLSYYPISLDTASPLPFQIKIDGTGSDNPSPHLSFETNDSLSGLATYEIMVDRQKVLEIASTSVTLFPQSPGTHELAVRAFDKAGNSTEDVQSFEILPIATPTIDFVTQTASVGESLLVSGTAIPDAFVELRILNGKRVVAMVKNSNSDSQGNWTLQFKGDLPIGSYSISAVAHDERGALSLPSEQRSLAVTPPVIISFGFVQLGWFEIFMTLLLVAVTGGSLFSWYYVGNKNMESAYSTIAVRDVKKFGDILDSHLKELETGMMNGKSTTGPPIEAKVQHEFAQLHDTVTKMKKYLVDVIKKS